MTLPLPEAFSAPVSAPDHGGGSGCNDTGEGRDGAVLAPHLAQGPLPALSQVEYTLTVTAHSFQRWIVQGMAAAGQPNMSPLEIVILHNVYAQPRSFTDVCQQLNIHNVHLCHYAIRKLVAAGLVTTRRAGKEKIVQASPAGLALCDMYRRVRDSVLLGNPAAIAQTDADLAATATLLRSLAAAYERAAQAVSQD